jgi:hypothetical protein
MTPIHVLISIAIIALTSDLYLRHAVKRHPDWIEYPGPKDGEI